MIREQIKQLEKELWDAADSLGANSKLTVVELKYYLFLFHRKESMLFPVARL